MLRELIEISRFLSNYTFIFVVPCLVIISVIFYIKNRSIYSLILSIGTAMSAIGFFLGFKKIAEPPNFIQKFDDYGVIVSESGNFTLWFLTIKDTILLSGIIIAVIGFALVTFVHKKNI